MNATGWYWIDPNSGMPDDAVYVYCNMTIGGQTCIYPDVHSSRMPNIPWRKENENGDWFSNLRGAFKVINLYIQMKSQGIYIYPFDVFSVPPSSY